MKYTLVAQSEADLKSGKISVDSPIGKGLLGKKVGEIATISVPSGKIELEILSIFSRVMKTLFSKIISGEIPSYKVAENNSCFCLFRHQSKH